MVQKVDELARILKVLAVGTRLKMIRILQGRSLCVCVLASQLHVTQGAVSQHLRIMRDAGLVVDEKRGYYVHYRLNKETLDRWRKQIDGIFAPHSAAVCRCSGENRRICKKEHLNHKERGR